MTNNGSSAVSNWQVSWQYTDGSVRTSGWNANVTGNNPYTATDVGWNATIQPQQFVEFGIQGVKGSANAQVPTVTGNICN